MRHIFEIPGTLPTLNEYVNRERANRYAAAALKKKAQQQVIASIRSDAPRFAGDVTVWFTWIRPDMRCDKDNVAFAKKFILDALQAAGVIKKDSWKLCTPYDAGFAVNKKNPRTIVEIEDGAHGRREWHG